MINLSRELHAAAESARARIRVGYPWWLRLFVMKGIAGITLGRRIYVSPAVSGGQLERLLRHELAHVTQIARYGLIRFYWTYISEYISYRRAGLSSIAAYRNISFEKEAFSAEENV